VNIYELEEGYLYKTDSSVDVFRVKDGHLEKYESKTWQESWFGIDRAVDLEFEVYTRLKDEFVELLESLYQSYSYITVSDDGVLEAYVSKPHVIDGRWECRYQHHKCTHILLNVDTPFTSKDGAMYIWKILLREETNEGCDL